MAFPKLSFTKSWKNAVDFPTVETNETKVRADMQYLFDEIKEALNALIDKLNLRNLESFPTGGVVTSLGADNTTIPTSKAVKDAMTQVGQLPSGGIAGQVLGKKSGTNFDMGWTDIPRSQPRTGILTAAGWSNNSQTIAVEGVTASNNVCIDASTESYEAYAEAGVRCTAQAAGTLTFTCKRVPEEALTVNFVILP